jgi:lysyl-tRNA synthetase class 2
VIEQSLDWHPGAGLPALRLRAGIYRLIRAFFEARGVLEVETPVLSSAANTDANIRSFTLTYSGPAAGDSRQRYLRTSPEFALKRLLAAGVGDCYELGRVFRDGEAGTRHNPEFTMLEWYRVGWDHHRLIDEVEALLRDCFALVGQDLRSRRLDYGALYREALGLDPFASSEDELLAALAPWSIDPDGLSRDDLLDLLMSHCIEPARPADELLFVHGFPPSQAALARVEGEGASARACRFEALVGGVELANGYHELTDAGEQARRFGADLALRERRGDPALPVDRRLLAALEAGLPPCAGVALGVDRLLMRLLGTQAIDDVLAFAQHRA